MASYPRLDTLIRAYFNQDADLVADTIEGLVADYMNGHGPEKRQALQRDIRAFIADHPNDLDAAFEAAYGFDVDPVLWDHTAESFLRKVDELLRP